MSMACSLSARRRAVCLGVGHAFDRYCPVVCFRRRDEAVPNPTAAGAVADPAKPSFSRCPSVSQPRPSAPPINRPSRNGRYPALTEAAGLPLSRQKRRNPGAARRSCLRAHRRPGQRRQKRRGQAACEQYLQAHEPVAPVFYWLGLLSEVAGSALEAQGFIARRCTSSRSIPKR